jgi:glutamate 5-kinase
LTREDFQEGSNRTLNIRNTLFTLLDEGVIPIINENDSVSIAEIKIGDNDTLSALTANLWDADTLIILSDIDGVFNCDPKSNPKAELIEEVNDIDKLMETIDVKGMSSFGTGGIVTKIEAARTVNKYGTNLILLNGRKPNIIKHAIDGEAQGTVFVG